MRASSDAFNNETFSLLLGLSTEVGLSDLLLEDLGLIFAVVLIIRLSNTGLGFGTLAAQIAGVRDADKEESEAQSDPGFSSSHDLGSPDLEDDEHPDVSPHRE